MSRLRWMLAKEVLRGSTEDAWERMAVQLHLTRSSSIHYLTRAEAWQGGHPILQECTLRPRAPCPSQVLQGSSELLSLLSCLAELLLLSCSVLDGTTHHGAPRARVTLLLTESAMQGTLGLIPGLGRVPMPWRNWSLCTTMVSLCLGTWKPQLLSPCSKSTKAQVL